MIAYIAAFFCLAAMVVVVVSVRDINRFVIVPYEVRSPKVRKKYTFVMLSDLHNKAFGKKNKKLAEAVFRCAPDAVVCAGDMYTSEKGKSYENGAVLLETLAKRFPVYVADGNHEEKTARLPEQFGSMYQDYMKRLCDAGAEPLINERVILPEFNLSICGLRIDRDYFRRFVKKKMPGNYINALVGKADKERFQILIAHSPDYFEKYAAWGADLVLSGHIHGGVVRLPWLGGVISPSVRLFPKYDGGMYRIGDSTMILGRGLGMHSVPVRMWNPGEVVVVTLLPEDK